MSLIASFGCTGGTLARLSVGGTLSSSAGLVYLDNSVGGPTTLPPVGLLGSANAFTWTARASYSYQSGCQYQLIGIIGGVPVFDSGYQNVPAGSNIWTFALALSASPTLNSFLAVGAIQWVLWEQGASSCRIVAQLTTPVEVYAIPTPASAFNNVQQLPQGFPVELLRQFASFAQSPSSGVAPGMAWEVAAFNNAPALTFTRLAPVDAQEVATAVTRFVFTRNGVQYNRATMNPSFISTSDTGRFNLSNYVAAPTGYVVNCQDQNAVLWLMLTYVFGHNVTPYKITAIVAGSFNQFLINAQQLVGEGLCNNPGSDYGTMPALVMATVTRTGFTSHRICADQTAGGGIFDATIGPYFGISSQTGYASLVLDAASAPTMSAPVDYTTQYQGLQFY